MIIVGLEIEEICCTGASFNSRYCFECVDYHEAAIEILKSQNGGLIFSKKPSFMILKQEKHGT